MSDGARQKFVVVGAGPVGALAALFAARRGNDVTIYELRSDLRLDNTTPLNFTKSINLALSERGINSIRAAQCPGLLDSILEDTIPMHGRMVHSGHQTSPTQKAQKYDAHGRYIRAADRAGLNKRLLDELESMPNVRLYFDHKLTGADFNRRIAWLQRRSPNPTHNSSKQDSDPSDGELEISFDFMIGADGAHSAVRYHLMKYARVDYLQHYIDTLWCEFHIAPDPTTKSFAIDPHHLHIWPSPTGEFMFIAIPSTDFSFTCTLFMPASHFAHINTDPATHLVPFFTENFPALTPNLISAVDLIAQYSRNPHLPLISIKCSPHTYGSSAAIVGDAAHAMVPFYGQGMNAGLEDVRVLFETLDAHTTGNSDDKKGTASTTDFATALAVYTKLRVPDAHAINDLAMGNYFEMRAGVKSPLYLVRKNVEEWLSIYVPQLEFATQYARVSFGNERYSEVVERVARQGDRLKWAGSAVIAGLGVATIGLALKLWRGGRR